MLSGHVDICPECGGFNIDWDVEISNCKDCGWFGSPWDLGTGGEDDDYTLEDARRSY